MDNKELPALEHPKILPLFYNRENGVFIFSWFENYSKFMYFDDLLALRG